MDDSDITTVNRRLSGGLLQSLTAELRQDLVNRIQKFVSGRSRGSLRLPRRYPDTVRYLTRFSKTKLVSVCFWCKPDHGTSHYLSGNASSFFHRVLRGKIWTHDSATLPSTKDQNVTRLTRKHAPGGARAVWPSTPDAFEAVAMTQLGKPIRGPPSYKLTVKHCLTRRAVSDDIRLASRIVRQCIIGVRSSVRVPSNFTKYFRGRHDFLVLSTRYNLPAGLVRFLIGQWVRCPTSLWLVQPCNFRTFLRMHTSSQFLRGVPCQACALRTGFDAEAWARPNTNNSNQGLKVFVHRGLLHVIREADPSLP